MLNLSNAPLIYIPGCINQGMYGPRSETPTHICKDFSPSIKKMADLTVFFKIFADWDPFLRVFLP